MAPEAHCLYNLYQKKFGEKFRRTGAAKFAKGEGAFQLAAMTKVKKLGFECEDATKAQSIFQSVNCAKGEGNFQLAAKMELKKRGIECDESTKAQSILQSVKYAKGEGNFQLAAKTELKKFAPMERQIFV